jgi:hypothetical protein
VGKGHEDRGKAQSNSEISLSQTNKILWVFLFISRNTRGIAIENGENPAFHLFKLFSLEMVLW